MCARLEGLDEALLAFVRDQHQLTEASQREVRAVLEVVVELDADLCRDAGAVGAGVLRAVGQAVADRQQRFAVGVAHLSVERFSRVWEAVPELLDVLQLTWRQQAAVLFRVELREGGTVHQVGYAVRDFGRQLAPALEDHVCVLGNSLAHRVHFAHYLVKAPNARHRVAPDVGDLVPRQRTHSPAAIRA